MKVNSVENMWIRIETNKKSLILKVVYRHPIRAVEHISLFTSELSNLFHSLNLQKLEFCIVGDCNIDLLQSEKNHHVRMYADSLISCSVKCTISKATRITTSSEALIDHICTVNLSKKYLSGITASADLSDHLSAFIAIPAKKLDRPNVGDRHLLIRDMPKFNTNNFLQDLNAALEIVNFHERSSVHETFEKFVAVFAKTANEHASMKRASRTEKRIRSKPWLSSSLLKSIRKKNQLFKRYLKTKDKLAHAEYKSYRNALNRSIENAKQMHYRDLLKETKAIATKYGK